MLSGRSTGMLSGRSTGVLSGRSTGWLMLLSFAPSEAMSVCLSPRQGQRYLAQGNALGNGRALKIIIAPKGQWNHTHNTTPPEKFYWPAKQHCHCRYAAIYNCVCDCSPRALPWAKYQCRYAAIPIAATRPTLHFRHSPE
jgi:hypothetical protein